MQSDIEICRNTPLSSIATVAANAGLLPHEFDTHGKHKAKVHPHCLERLNTNTNQDGKLVLVTAITPTPLGEGKTVTTIGLSQGLSKINQSIGHGMYSSTVNGSSIWR